MKKLMLSKKFTVIMLVVFLFTVVAPMSGFTMKAMAEDLPDFLLSHNQGNKTFSQGDKFDLILTMKNITADKTISNISVDFSNAGIIAKTDGGTIHEAGTEKTIAPNNIEELPKVEMRFTGDGSVNIAPVKVTYSLDDGASYKTVTVNLFFNTQKSSSGSSDTFDPADYKPMFQVDLTSYGTVSAGKSNTISLSIKNISTTSAKNVNFIPPLDNKNFESAKALNSMPFSQIAPNSAVELKISVDVNKFATEGVQRFTFKLTGTNPWNIPFESEHTIDLRIINTVTNVSFDMQFPNNQTVTASAGGTFTLPLILKNKGNLSAKDVRVTLADLSQDTFMLSSGTGIYDFYRIHGNESYNLTYTLNASPTLKSGSYPLNFNISYIDEKGDSISEKLVVWIPVVGSQDRVSMLEFIEISPSNTTIKPGESFDVTVKIKNAGGIETGQVKVWADGTESLLPVSQNMHIISNLKKDEIKTIIFKFQANPTAPRGSIPITIKVESLENGQNTSIAQAIAVFNDADPDSGSETGKNEPKIIIKSYWTDPTLVKAGERFTLNMQFLNTHASKTIRNIKGNFAVTEASSETGSVFSPVESSNTFYIDSIGPKGTHDWNVTLFTIPDAKSKTYTVTITFEYEDEAGNPITANEIIGIPVYQPSRFEISELMLPPEAYMGNPIYVAFEMYNMGKTDIYNVKFTVEGDFDAQPKSNYFGNFTSGYREYFEINLIPMMVGQCNGKLIFQYENSSGEQLENVKEFSMNVMEMMMPPGGEMPVDGYPMEPGMENPEGGFFGSVWFYIILGVVVVGIVIVVVIIVRKRKKTNEEFDF